MAKNMHKPCVMERWLAEPEVADKIEDHRQHLDDVVNKASDEVEELLWTHITQQADFGLFTTLRGLHIALASQLGIVEGWMRQILEGQENIPPNLIDEERERLFDVGQKHVESHYRDNGPKIVH